MERSEKSKYTFNSFFKLMSLKNGGGEVFATNGLKETELFKDTKAQI